MYRALFCWFWIASFRMNSNSTSCNNSLALGMPSNTELRYSNAFSWLMPMRAANALRLHVLSLSDSRKAWMSSGASGMRASLCW